MAEESAGIEPKPSPSKRILRTFSYWVTIFTLFLVVGKGLNDVWGKITSPQQHTEKTFLDGFRDYVGGLIGQIGALTPGQVRQTFFDRLETCHYGWKLKCQPIHATLLLDSCEIAPQLPCEYDDPPDSLKPWLYCVGVPSERLLNCEKDFRATHPFTPRRKLAYAWSETLLGVPDAAWETAKMVHNAGWLATAIFGASSLFVVISFIAMIASTKPKDWTIVNFYIICWLVAGVPFLVSGVAWALQWMMKAAFGIAYGLLSLVALGIGFGSVLTVILEIKHLLPRLASKD